MLRFDGLGALPLVPHIEKQAQEQHERPLLAAGYGWLDEFECAIALLRYLGVEIAERCVIVNVIARATALVVEPMKAVNNEPSVLEKLGGTVEAIVL